jgi:threonine dehydratase
VVEVLEAAARLKGRVLRSPLRRSEWLSSLAGRDVRLKLESLQPTGSFKIRGAFNAALRHGSQAPLVTASAGNHGRALAYAAEALGLSLTVYVPAGAPRAKQDAIRRHGAELKQVADYDEAERAAKAHAASGRVTYVSPYAHPDVIAGAGTIALEVLEDLPDAATIVVPLGGGGLASGIGIVARALSHVEGPDETGLGNLCLPRVARPRVIGVEAEASTAFAASLAAGCITTIVPKPTLADGLAGNLDPDSPTFQIVRDTVDEVISVPEAALRAAMRGLAEHEHLIAEGAGAAGVAAIQTGLAGRWAGPIVAVVSGANVDVDRLMSAIRSSGR